MKAVIYTKYGLPDVLQLKEVEIPVPKNDEVLIKVHATSINSYDWRLLTADPFLVRMMGGGFLKPRNQILGADIAGQVVAIGNHVTQFQPGEAVFGDNTVSGCGGLAEYVCARESVLVLKPSNITFDEAAAVPMAALTALQGLRDMGHIQPGQKVLIHGASGGVGTFAVQIAKTYGAEVTAVCSTSKTEMVRALGAEHVIDYTRQDFTQNGRRYDLIFAANGNRSIFEYKRALTPDGIYVMAGGSNKQIFQAVLLGSWASMSGNQKLGALTAKSDQNDLLILKTLLENGKIKPVIDRVYPLSEAAEAFRYLGEGHARGKIIVKVH